jgi:hypothetical protein
LTVILVAGGLLTLAGCQRKEPSGAPAPSGSSVKIVGITPDTSVPLRSGERVRLKVDVSYSLTVDSGTVALVIQAADNSGIAQNMQVLSKGEGKTSLEAEFTVPNTKAVQIFTPLSVQGQASTSTVDYRVYKVVSN